MTIIVSKIEVFLGAAVANTTGKSILKCGLAEPIYNHFLGLELQPPLGEKGVSKNNESNLFFCEKWISRLTSVEFQANDNSLSPS